MHYVTSFLVLNAVPLALDFLMCIWAVARNIRGHGRSVVPVLTLFLYAYGIFRVAPFGLPVRFAMFATAVAVHEVLTFLIPIAALRLRRGSLGKDQVGP